MRYYSLQTKQTVTLPDSAFHDEIKNLIRHYAVSTEFSFVKGKDNEITFGTPEPCEAGGEYTIHITENGVWIKGHDHASTVRGLFTFLEMIFCYGKNDYRAECRVVTETPDVKTRMIHICIFPEYPLEAIKRVIKCCGVAKYTHVILEPWGMLKFDTLKELSWPMAFSKTEFKDLIDCARLFGMEAIPFFQHFGHASASRIWKSGKHTALYQDLGLEYLYYPGSYGWIWNFNLPQVKDLLRSVRHELIELFDGCQYFHLGCDEPWFPVGAEELYRHLNEVADDLLSRGVRPIMWGDMLLCEECFSEGNYTCNATRDFADTLLQNLNKKIVIGDWQYMEKKAPWKTSAFLKEKGFDVLCCPWEGDDEINAGIVTAKEGGHLGFMKTTWDHLFLKKGIPGFIYAGMTA